VGLFPSSSLTWPASLVEIAVVNPMNRLLFLAMLLGLLCVSQSRAEDQIWQNNKLTASQPFPAAVVGVLQEWDGYLLLLEEIGGKGRLCIAQVWFSVPLEYTVIEDAQQKMAARKKAGWNFVSPGIELDRFSWSIGPWKIGRIFGEEDILRKAVMQKERINGASSIIK
jgi:hypothetical protein